MRQGALPFPATKISKGNYLYIWGAVYYEDGLGKHRTTHFCHRYACVNFADNQMAPEFARFHRYGNDAD
jgi:hypothetical protein